MRSLSPMLLATALALGCQVDGDDDTTKDGPTGTTDSPTDSHTGDSDAPTATMQMSGEIVCEAPFVRADLGTFARLTQREDAQTEQWFIGGGVALADLDGDGWLDWLLTGETEPRLYAWMGGHPIDATDRLGGIDLSNSSGAIPVDIEGDGDLDVFVSRYLAPDVVLINDGEGRFTDGTEATGLAGPAYGRSLGASFADIDHDGDLDAFISHYGPIDLTGRPAPAWAPGEPNRVYENVGGGVFVDRTDILTGAGSTGYTFVGGWVDLDDDGAWELYVVNDFGEAQGSNAWYRFDDWSLVPDDNTAGLDIVTHGMGLGIGDLNEDGKYDVLVSAWGNVHLLTSQGPLYFDTTQVMGMDAIDKDKSRVAWGNTIADLDNDGMLDAIINFGYVEVHGRWPNPLLQEDIIFRQTTPGVFENATRASGMVDRYSSRGLAVGDINRDGYVDVVKPALDDNDSVYLSHCGGSAWLEVDVTAMGDNVHGVGTRIKVLDGDRSWMQTIRAGGDTLSSGGPPEVHVGLGDLESVQTLEVRWPDGTVDTFHDVPTRRRLHITQHGVVE